MFTGIITDIGEVAAVKRDASTHKLTIRTRYNTQTIAIGASIAVSGVCLTVTDKTGDTVSFDIAEETTGRTTIGTWQIGTKVNLERALTIGDELGGHMVSGHVDGLATLLDLTHTGNGHVLTFTCHTSLMPYIAEKGSVTLDGVSLTVASVSNTEFTVALIPHTWQHTTLHMRVPEHQVHIEIDMLARYIRRLTECRTQC